MVGNKTSFVRQLMINSARKTYPPKNIPPRIHRSPLRALYYYVGTLSQSSFLCLCSLSERDVQTHRPKQSCFTLSQRPLAQPKYFSQQVCTTTLPEIVSRGTLSNTHPLQPSSHTQSHTRPTSTCPKESNHNNPFKPIPL